MLFICKFGKQSIYSQNHFPFHIVMQTNNYFGNCFHFRMVLISEISLILREKKNNSKRSSDAHRIAVEFNCCWNNCASTWSANSKSVCVYISIIKLFATNLIDFIAFAQFLLCFILLYTFLFCFVSHFFIIYFCSSQINPFMLSTTHAFYKQTEVYSFLRLCWSALLYL